MKKYHVIFKHEGEEYQLCREESGALFLRKRKPYPVVCYGEESCKLTLRDCDARNILECFGNNYEVVFENCGESTEYERPAHFATFVEKKYFTKGKPSLSRE